MQHAFDDLVILGVGETAVGKLPGRTSTDLQAEAVLKALTDAGMDKDRIDGFLNLDPYAIPESMFGQTVAEYLGICPRLVATIDVGGTVTIMRMLQIAAWAIASGECSVVACAYGENTLTGRRSGEHSLQMDNRLAGTDWEEPVGARGMVIPYALLAQRYFDTYGDATEAMATIAVTERAHALLNQNAQMRKPLDHEGYYAGRMISTPLRLYDCSLVSDGAGAIIVTNRGVAEQMTTQKPPIGITGLAGGFTHASVIRMPDLPALSMQSAGERAFAQAGITPDDIDVAEIHDAFTISVIITLESLGFCGPGEAGQYIRDTGIGLDSRCPINTHGGLLSQGHIGGILHVVEAVRQLRGEAGTRQVPDARRALVSGNGGIFSVCGVMVLERRD